MLRLLIIALAGAAFASCSTGIRQDPDKALSRDQITEIARKAVEENDIWVDRAEIGTPQAAADGSGWSVMVWRLPKTPGGHRLIRIDVAGQVISYSRGR